MKENIPISFSHKNQLYTGTLSGYESIEGTTWQLILNNYFYGNVVYSKKYGFRFHGHTLQEMEDYFFDVIVAWYG